MGGKLVDGTLRRKKEKEKEAPMKCPMCGGKVAKANVPKPLPNRYCAKCDMEWREKEATPRATPVSA
jgi:hypothetical protein